MLTIRVELDPRDAPDDVAARQTATTQYIEMLGSRRIPGVEAKLQEVYPDRPPRAVAFKPYREDPAL